MDRGYHPFMLRALYAAHLPPDLASLPPAQVMEAARTAWDRLCTERRWRPSYRQRARTRLLRAIETDEPLIARALNPRAKPHWGRGRHGRHVDTASSHETRFLLHDCLPLRVRAMPATSELYQVLFRVAEGLVRHMRSTCRHTLQKRMLFVLRLLQAPNITTTTHVTWEGLRQISALEWLRRLVALYRDQPHQRQRRSLAPRTLRLYLSTLRMLHEQVLGPRPVSDRDRGDVIPSDAGLTTLSPILPSCLRDETDDDNDDDHPPPPLNPEDEKQSLLAELKLYTRAHHGRHHPAQQQQQQWSFTPEEVLAILDGAVTTPERLIVMLLITTGLRIGGLSRLVCGQRPHWGHEIPTDALSTVEKGNKPRTLVLLAPVRILLARYFREDRPPPDSPFVFPAPRNVTHSLHTSNMAKRIHRVLRRANVRGGHAHPHTFRHTYVHMSHGHVSSLS